ncbi:MAG: diguanylate cyclase [Gammaproteobacteria bacterium]|nr:diguanylate cyclase [Gammaproteobacteria bacterium]
MDLDIILAVLLYFSALCYVLLSVRLIAGSADAGSKAVAVTFGIIGLWVLGGAVELSAANYTMFSIGRLGHFFGTALVPVSLLVCFRNYTGAATSKSSIAALLIVPLASIFIAASNHWHQFMWLLPATDDSGAFLTRPQQWGPWFLFLHAPHGYLVFGAAVLTLLLHSTAVAPAYRRGLFILAGSTVVPVTACVLYDVGIGPNTISTVPLVFAAMLPVYAWLIIGERMIEFSPLPYEVVFQNMQDPVIVVDEQQRVIGLNRGAELLLDIKEKEALRASLDSLFGADVQEVHQALDTGKPQKMLTTTGRFLHLQVTPISTNKAATRSGRVLMFRDVSDVEKAQKEVRSSEKLLRTLIDHSVNGIMRLRWIGIDDHRFLRCIFANAAAAKHLEVDSEFLLDRDANDVMRLAVSGMDTHEAARLLREFQQATESGEILDCESAVGSPEEQRWLRVICEPVGEDYAVTFVDITDRKAKERHMESIALTDSLTAVFNRRGFEREATRRLSQSNDNATGALLFVDLNAFKLVNDDFGHTVGDQVLLAAAKRLRASLRSQDIIGRPGGDEFVALVPDADPEIAEDLATRLTGALEEEYRIGAATIKCPASIGFALYPAHANTLTGLLRCADEAMYRAKARCRGMSDVTRADLLEKAG